MFTALTPESVIEERVAAFLRHDFSAIFHSYHGDAPFLHFFPDCTTYLSYAEAEIAGHFVIKACQLLRISVHGETAFVLFKQSLQHKGEECESFEIARCQHVDGSGWFYWAGLRLEAGRFPNDYLSCPWEELFAAGNNLWI